MTKEEKKTEPLKAEPKQEEEKQAKPPKQPGAIKKGFKWAFKPFVNVTGWMGYDIVRDSTRYMGGLAGRMIAPDKPVRTESFEEALVRLNLKETQLAPKMKSMMRLCMIYLCIAGFLLLYGLYFAFSGAFFVFFFSLILALIALSFAFRFHFWVFQIQHRKLGCTFKEWYTSKIDTHEPKRKVKK